MRIRVPGAVATAIQVLLALLLFFQVGCSDHTTSPEVGTRADGQLMADELADGFVDPPNAARTRTWWHWINGIVGREGITRDLEAIKSAGIGGFHLFQQGDTIAGPVSFGSSENFELMKFAAREADRLGLEFTMSAQPGCAGSGGPWITPELSMQMLVWSEAAVTGGQEVTMTLPRPYANLGYYRDAFVVAFPSLAGEENAMKDMLTAVSSNAGPLDAGLLTDYDLAEGVTVASGGGEAPGFLQLEFVEPFEACSIFMYSTQVMGGDGGGAPGRPPGGGGSLMVSDDGVNFRKITDLSTTQNGEGPVVPVLESIPTVKAKYFRIVFSNDTLVTEIQLSGAARYGKWGEKTNMGRGMGGGPFGPAKSEEPVTEIPSGAIVDPAAVIDLSGFMDADGRLVWQAPEGNWTILRIGHTSTGTKGHPQPEGGQGLEADHLSRAAMDFHFEHMLGDFIAALDELGIKGVAGGLIDSYEAGNQNWSATVPEEFQARRGYSMLQYMPAMTGRVVGSGDITERFLWDFRRTEADMMADNFYGRFAELCRENNMISYAEAYSGIFEDMQAGSRVDVPMGEFWTGTGHQDSIKKAASIAHTNGKKTVGAESYTSQPTFSKWQEYPYALKAQGDWMFTRGLNQIVYHQYVHQANTKVAPGLTMRSVGGMFSATNTWWDQSKPWQDYLARCQYLLSKGLFVADVLYLNSEDPSDTGINAQAAILPMGYDYDSITAESFLAGAAVKDGRIVMPDGMSYGVLVLPGKKMTPKLLGRVRDMVADGMSLVVTGSGPSTSPGLSGYPESGQTVREITAELWGDLDGAGIWERSFGKGRVFWSTDMAKILTRLDIQPDLEYTSETGDAPVSTIHRQVDGADVYFIANRRRQSVDLACSFRVGGKRPELWNPVTGEITPMEVYEAENGRVQLPVLLDPAGSVFVVFRSPAAENRLEEVEKDGRRVLGAQPYQAVPAGRYANVSGDFTISVWVKPEVEVSLAMDGGRGFGMMGGGTGFLFYPPSGEEVYGTGHAACGLTAGRNGICLFERSGGNAAAVLAAEKPLSGWTHVAVVYRDNTPSLFVNGELAAEGRKSGNIVHPGINEFFERDQASYLIGDFTEPELLAGAADPEKIQASYRSGAPDVEGPPAVQPAEGMDGEFLFWQNGVYSFRESAGGQKRVEVNGIGAPYKITGPWEVEFPEGLGAPSRTVLPELISLHRHPEEGIKYFSGTATYSNRFEVNADTLGSGRRLFLDLGRVEVSAEVLVNGENMGILWKPPYKVDITDSVHEGENTLEVRVATLWPNRLIGDEQLPEENQYGPPTGEQGLGLVALPDWYIENKSKPGERITFASWKHYDKDDPLLASGLLGPVRLRTAVLQGSGD